MTRELEVCAETLQACIAAEQGGADRVELCSGLSEGGVTPSHGLLRAAIERCKLPIHVLLRPRGGNFVYSGPEFSMMCADLEHAAMLGVAGFVTGCLTTGGDVDAQRLRTLVALAGERPITFHRAFDRSSDIDAAFGRIVDAGCRRLLTSGGEPEVMQGRMRLAELAGRAAGHLRVAAGGGVTPENAADLCRIDGLDLHGSFRVKGPALTSGDPLWLRNEAAGLDISAEVIGKVSAIVHATSAVTVADAP